jgi:hypothetical protein
MLHELIANVGSGISAAGGRSHAESRHLLRTFRRHLVLAEHGRKPPTHGKSGTRQIPPHAAMNPIGARAPDSSASVAQVRVGLGALTPAKAPPRPEEIAAKARTPESGFLRSVGESAAAASGASSIVVYASCDREMVGRR